MTTTRTILEAVRQLVTEGFPAYQLPGVEGLTVCLEHCTPEVLRPSLLIQWENTVRQAVSAGLCQVTEELSLTLLGDGENSPAAGDSLLALREQVLALFSPGYLPVGDRALAVQSAVARREEDTAIIDVRLEFFDALPRKEETAPLMEHVHTNLQAKE